MDGERKVKNNVLDEDEHRPLPLKNKKLFKN